MKSILETFSTFVDLIKEAFLGQDGSINGKAIRIPYLKTHFPGFLELIEETYGSIDDYREILYCILKDIDERPKCKNPKCSNLVPLRKFHSGFQKFCCVECQNEWQRNSEEFSKAVCSGVKDYKEEQFKNATDKLSLFLKNYEFEHVGNFYRISNFCHHGNLERHKQIVKIIIEKDLDCSICIECNKELFDSYIPTEKEILDFQSNFKEFFNEHHFAMKSEWWLTYYPKFFKILTVYYERYFEPVEKYSVKRGMYYVFMNNIKGFPECAHPNCHNKVRFSIESSKDFNVFCDEHMKGYNASYVELSMEDYLNQFGLKMIRNSQNIIKGELDFYFPEKNLAIEFNGCWFHSDNFKPKNYHMNKWKECREKGIQLISIWEDDWNFKKDIVKSILKSKLGLTQNSVGARECEIKEVSYEDASIFLEENHLQGNIVSKFRYGLFYKDDLVQLVTFGNSRFKKGELELLRFCTKKDWQVIGGFSRLVKFFIKEHKVKNFISYANCDISDGKVYSMFGMKETRHTENWGWFDNGKRINRFNKAYRLNKDKVFHKCYTSGTLKFEYSN